MRILKIPYITEPGSVVYRIKASDADNDDIIFDVLEDYGKSLIRFEKISPNEANVILISPLKKDEEYNLTIYANTGEESTYIESRLIVTDIGPKPFKEVFPFIIETDPVYVYENMSLNNSITVVKAFEQDDSELPVTFELLEDNEIFHFRYIFGPRGMSVAEIILLNQLDYEQQNLFILTILAINGKTQNEIDTRNVHQTRLTIVVKDIQDTPPKFDNLPQTCFISDTYRPNQIIFNVQGQDGDVINKRNLTFSIKKPDDKYFKINLNGNVWSSFSYDQLSRIYDVRSPIVLNIEANEIVTSPLTSLNDSTSSQSNLIIIFDLNNRIPHFSESEFFGNIDEHSAYLTSVRWRYNHPQVYDEDYGFNGTFELSIIDETNTFIISPMTGYRNLTFTLLVNDSNSLDYEKYHNLTVIINVKDFSQKYSLINNVICTIFIIDINDNYPEFSQSRYYSSLLENSPEGTIVTTLEVFDKDTGEYGQVCYTDIRGPYAQNFKIIPMTGAIVLVNNENIDREMIGEIFVTIEVRDNLGTGNLNTTELYIQILDVNDNPPLFLQQNYLGILKNDLMEFVHPLKVDAIDIDQINTINSIVNYEILQGNYEDIFKIDRTTGKIKVKRRDRFFTNIPNFINLTIRAYDLGIPQMSSLVKVYIYVLNTPTYLPTLFSTNQILDIRNGNNSLEKSLSMITGGNVTVKEFRSSEIPNEPMTIVTMVKYQNENTIDLDNLALAYRNLFYIPSSDSTVPEIPTKTTKQTYISKTQTMDLELKSSKIKNYEDFEERNVKTTSINFLLYFLLALIIILLIFLLCFCYFLYKRKRDSETKNELKNMWFLQKNNTIKPNNFPNSKRKINKRSENKLLAMNHPNKQMIQQIDKKIESNKSNDDWFRTLERKFQDEDVKYEIREEKKYSNTPRTMSYYICKKIIRPKVSDQSRQVDILNLENGETNIEHHRLFYRKKISDQPHENNKKNINFTFGELEDDKLESKNKFVSENIQNVQFKNLSSIKHITNVNKEDILGYPNKSVDLNLARKSQNMQRRSIFSIAYNGIENRENISSESDKTLYNFN